MMKEHIGEAPNQALEDGSSKAFREAMMFKARFMKGVLTVILTWLCLLKSSLGLMLQICSLYFTFSLGISLLVTFGHLSYSFIDTIIGISGILTSNRFPTLTVPAVMIDHGYLVGFTALLIWATVY